MAAIFHLYYCVTFSSAHGPGGEVIEQRAAVVEDKGRKEMKREQAESALSHRAVRVVSRAQE